MGAGARLGHPLPFRRKDPISHLRATSQRRRQSLWTGRGLGLRGFVVGAAVLAVLLSGALSPWKITCVNTANAQEARESKPPKTLAGPRQDWTIRQGERAWMDGRLVPLGFLEARDGVWQEHAAHLEVELELRAKQLSQAEEVIVELSDDVVSLTRQNQELETSLHTSSRSSRQWEAYARSLEGQDASQAVGLWRWLGGGAVGLSVGVLVGLFVGWGA